ncbi:MAG: hypothetical protein ACOVO1_01860 [Chitinophagaceae bacterium]
MKNQNRDLLVVTKKNGLDRLELEQTIINLNTVLYEVESFKNVCIASEVIDLNKYKIHTSTKKVSFYIRNKSKSPYIFIYNKN